MELKLSFKDFESQRDVAARDGRVPWPGEPHFLAVQPQAGVPVQVGSLSLPEITEVL